MKANIYFPMILCFLCTIKADVFGTPPIPGGYFQVTPIVNPTPMQPGNIELRLKITPLIRGGDITIEILEVDNLTYGGPMTMSAKAEKYDTVEFVYPLVIPALDTSGIYVKISDSVWHQKDKFYWVTEKENVGFYRGNPRLFPSAKPKPEQKIFRVGEPWDTAAYLEELRNRTYAEGYSPEYLNESWDGRPYSFGVEETIEPSPARPGPLNLILTVSPNFKCRNEITAEVTLIDNMKYEGPMILSGGANNFDLATFEFPIVIPDNKGAEMYIKLRAGNRRQEMHYYWHSREGKTEFYIHPDLDKKPRPGKPQEDINDIWHDDGESEKSKSVHKSKGGSVIYIHNDGWYNRDGVKISEDEAKQLLKNEEPKYGPLYPPAPDSVWIRSDDDSCMVRIHRSELPSK